MRNKYMNCEKNPWSKAETYYVKFENAFYDVLAPFRPEQVTGNFSYYYVLPSLFGMRPREFFSFIVSTYNAKIIKAGNYKNLHFDNATDCTKFTNECNERFGKVVKAIADKQ